MYPEILVSCLLMLTVIACAVVVQRGLEMCSESLHYVLVTIWRTSGYSVALGCIRELNDNLTRLQIGVLQKQSP